MFFVQYTSKMTRSRTNIVAAGCSVIIETRALRRADECVGVQTGWMCNVVRVLHEEDVKQFYCKRGDRQVSVDQ